MGSDHRAMETAGPAAPRREGAASAARSRLLRAMAIQDWVLVAFLTMLTLAVAGSPPSPAQRDVLRNVAVPLVLCVGALFAVRAELVRGGWAAPLLYRLTLLAGLLSPYLQFRKLLPVVNPGSLDAALASLDRNVLGVEPAVWLERFATPAVTEWFAFFYFAYFLVLAAHVFPFLLLSRRSKLLAEFSLGMVLTVIVAHSLYLVVPGYGPYRFQPEAFRSPLPDGFWMRMVWAAVHSGGAQKDIFPSLHTAAPLFVALFSFRHRAQVPMRWTWHVTSFFAVNIVVATMFLRWHYATDVLAGIVLAVAASIVAARWAPREVDRRSMAGIAPVYPPLFGRPELR